MQKELIVLTGGGDSYSVGGIFACASRVADDIRCTLADCGSFVQGW